MHREVTDYQIQHKWLPEQKNVALDHNKAQLKKISQQSVIIGASNDTQFVRFIIIIFYIQGTLVASKTFLNVFH